MSGGITPGGTYGASASYGSVAARLAAAEVQVSLTKDRVGAWSGNPPASLYAVPADVVRQWSVSGRIQQLEAVVSALIARIAYLENRN